MSMKPKTVCNNGHRMAGDNVKYDSRGHQVCIICEAARWQRAREREFKAHIPAVFLSRTRREGEHLMWTGDTYPRGYGRYSGTTAQRAAYLIAYGPIPAGLEIDHLCRIPLCVEPTHLEAVTRAENLRRRDAAKQECKRGHSFTAENTYINPSGARVCRACRRFRYSAYKAQTVTA